MALLPFEIVEPHVRFYFPFQRQFQSNKLKLLQNVVAWELMIASFYTDRNGDKAKENERII